MPNEDVSRKDLDNAEFLSLRQTTEKIAGSLNTRLKTHLAVIKPLFAPQNFLGSYMKGTSKKDVPGSDKAFATLQQRYASLAEKPLGLRKELSIPLSAISPQLICTPYQYKLQLGENGDKITTVTSPTQFILAYENECSLNRIRAMVAGTESRQVEEIKQSVLCHICMTVLLEQIPMLGVLLRDLRYDVEIQTLNDLGGLSVAVLSLPLRTFLPSDKFITEVTQLSGIPAFQEIIDLGSLEGMADPLKNAIEEHL